MLASGPPPVRYRLHRPTGPTGPPWQPSPDQRRVIEHTGRRLRVLAGPGSGKTATLVEAVAQRVQHRGIDPAQMLVLTFSRRAATELTSRISQRLAITTAEPLVRTLHSYAYALLKAEAARSGSPAPRLLGAAESDRMVADLLAGHLESGATDWPAHLRPALASRAFASELRDLILRTGERALSPARIAELGRRHKRPEWVAAARLAREYQQVVDLRMGTTGLGAALDQAELTLSALELLGRDEVLAVEQARIRRLFVDEYQDVDPAQATLVERLAAGADELVVVGDPDQSIYGFRGSDPAAVRRLDADSTVALAVSRRAGTELLAATRRVAALLPGTADHRRMVAAPEIPPGSVEIRILPTAAREAAYIADRLRRAHLTHGVDWARMAVVLRSPAAALPALRRAFSAAGVPLTVPPGDRGLLPDPVVAALVSLVECGLDPDLLDGSRAHALLTAPLGGAGGMDALALRRLRRSVRVAAAGRRGEASDVDRTTQASAADRPTEAPLDDPPAEASTADLLACMLSELADGEQSTLLAGAGPDVAGTARRLAGLLRTAREVARLPDGESALWRIWSATGLQDELTAVAERGGRAGQRADAALDAVLELFGRAADLATRLPGAGVRAFVDQARGEQLPGDPAAGAARAGDAVTVLSAHAAKGLEWDLVAVAGVQEGSWPDLRARGGLLATGDLLDRAAGLDESISRVAATLADERRLFYVACTRAGRELLVTAVSDGERAPSRFLDELAGSDSDSRALRIAEGWPLEGLTDRRGFHLAELVGELRRAITAPGASPEAVTHGARQLARLARAGVPGAHPRYWYALAGLSTDAPAVPVGTEVAVSPSAVDALQQCALRGVLERRGARGPIGDPQMIGMVVHAAAHGLSEGVSRTDVVAEIDRFLAGQEQLPDWQLRRVRRAVTTMTDAVADWLETGPAAGRRTLGSELSVDLPLGPAAAIDEPDSAAAGADVTHNPVRMTGRIDHLAQLDDGSILVTDFKTSASMVSVADAKENLQLAAYQLALALDGVPGAHGAPAGAQLLYLRGGSAKSRAQGALDPELAATTVTAIRSSAGRLAGARLIAQENLRCDRCPVRSCCPLQSEGRQVTR